MNNSNSNRTRAEEYIDEFEKLAKIRNTGGFAKKINGLIDIADKIISGTDPGIREGFLKKLPYYHHDMRQLFIDWRKEVLDTLKKHEELFVDEVSVISESSSVSAIPFKEEYPYLKQKNFADKLLDNIRKETSKRKSILLEVRKKSKGTLTGNDSIHKITIAKISDRQAYLVAVNEDFKNTFSINAKNGSYFQKFFNSKNRKIEADSDTLNYLNKNKKNALFSRSDYPLQNIAGSSNGFLYPEIEIEKISEALFKNKQKNRG